MKTSFFHSQHLLLHSLFGTAIFKLFYMLIHLDNLGLQKLAYSFHSSTYHAVILTGKHFAGVYKGLNFLLSMHALKT